MRLYKDNRIDGEFKLMNTQVADLFMASPWLHNSMRGWPLSRSLGAFIGAPEVEGGLSSTFDIDEDPDFMAVLDLVIDRFSALNRESIK